MVLWREGLPPVNAAELRHDLTNHEDFFLGTVDKRKDKSSTNLSTSNLVETR